MATNTQSILSGSNSINAKDTFLRRVLFGNIAFSIISGGAFIIGANPMGAFMGIPQPLILMGLGAGVLLFALGVYLTATQQPLDPRKATFILVADIAWVVATEVILMLDLFGLTTEGRWLIFILADIVTVFAILEFFGLRRLR